MSMNHPFTATYIQMAKAAEEIQAMRADEEDYILGDWFRGDQGAELFDRSTGYLGQSPSWLPLLHQLLGMIGDVVTWQSLMMDIQATDLLLRPYWPNGKADWHEVALRAVMLKKYSKVWTGTEWVRE